MANDILMKYGTSLNLAITLSALPTSTTGVGRKAVFVSNISRGYSQILLYVRLKQGTSPTGGKTGKVRLFRADTRGAIGAASTFRTDNAGASNVVVTMLNAPLIGILANKAAPATGDIIAKSFIIENPGAYWSVGIEHNTGVNLGVGASQYVRWAGVKPQVQ